MNEKESFEDIIASKFAEAEFPFDEGNWDNAEDMISSYRTKQKRRRFGLVFFSGIALGVLIMFPFVKINKTDNVIAEAVNTSTEKTNLENINTDPPVTQEHKEIQNEITNVVTNITSETKTNGKQVAINSDNKPSHTKIATAPNFNKINKQRKAKQKHITVSETTSEQLNNLVQNKEEITVLSKIDNNITLTDDSIPFVALVDELPKMADTKPVLLPWNFSVVGGGNFVNSFSFNPIQGIEISKPVTPHLEIGTGAYYTYLSIHSGGVKTIITHTEYDFGYKADVTEIKTNKLHYAVIPVYAKYKINDKNAFIFGANMFALFTASNSVTSYRESYGVKQGVVSKKTAGYSNGINTYDIGLLAGYQRHLFWNIGAAIYFNYGLKDIKKNAYYNENKFERNISGQFMLTYTL